MSSAIAQTPAPKPASVAPAPVVQLDDPAIRRGVLANGLRYAVMRNAKPEGGLSMRLGMTVGSADERGVEAGAAHFVEHMAFRATRSFPDNDVISVFQRRGVTAGRDQNAATEMFATTFQLDLPSRDQATDALALRWLHDVGDGVVFTQAGVDAERGVVLAEKETRSGVSEAAQDVAAFLTPDARAVDHPGIGDVESLGRMTAAGLKDFYDRWYRPENAAVVIVGDRSLDEMEGLVRGAFDDWRGRKAPASHPPRSFVDESRGVEAFARSAPTPITTAAVCRASSSQSSMGDADRRRAQSLSLVWREVLTRRLADLRLDPANVILGANLSLNDDDHDARTVCVYAIPAGDNWKPGLLAMRRELDRFVRDAPTELEVEHALEERRGLLRAAISGVANRTNSTLADTILEATLDGRETPEARQALLAFDLVTDGLAPADVHAAFLRDWRGSGPLITVVSPQAPDKALLQAAWTEGAATSQLKAYADAAAKPWPYRFAPVGVVASRTEVPAGYVRIRFRNGILLNFKQTTFSKSNAQLVLRFGSGRRGVADADYYAAALGGALFQFGGLGKLSAEEITASYCQFCGRFTLNIARTALVIQLGVSVVNLATQTQVLAAYMSDPGFSPSLDPLLKVSVNLAYRAVAVSPAAQASDALFRNLGEGGVDFVLPPRSALEGLSSATVARVLRPAVVGAPLEVTIVGDLTEARAIEIVADSFAAGPPRKAATPQTTPSYLRIAPGQPPVTVEARHEGPKDQAAVVAAWPLYVASPARRREEYALRLLASIFTDRMTRRIRGELGKTYSPVAASRMPDDGDQGLFLVSVESYPADVGVVAQEVRAVAERLASGDVLPADLEAARAPLLNDARTALLSNARWAAGVAAYADSPAALDDLTGYAALLNAVTLEDVKAEARRWFSARPSLATALPDANGAPAR